jgi:pimeloyl-ACP methyl ester carboxylesterase
MDCAGLNRQLARFRSAYAEKNLNLGSAAWQYFDSGQGKECIVLLHGSLVTGESFFPFVDAFPAPFRILLPSTAGSITSMEEAVSGVLAILDKEGIAQAHVFGHSLGGMVAQCLVRRAADRIATLILSSTEAPSEAEAVIAQRDLARVRLLPEWFIRAYLRLRPSRDAPELTPDQLRFFAEYVAAPGVKQRALSSALIQLDYHRNFRFSVRDLEDWPGRVLIAACQNDKVVTTASYHQLSALYPGASRHVFPNAGHMSMLGRVSEYAGLILNFISNAQMNHYNVVERKTSPAP